MTSTVFIQGPWGETWAQERFHLHADNDWGILVFSTDDNLSQLRQCRTWMALLEVAQDQRTTNFNLGKISWLCYASSVGIDGEPDYRSSESRC